MLYKTIVLEMLLQRPQMHNQLRKDRQLLSTLNLYAAELKTSHEAWQKRLAEAMPGSEPSQIASVATEMALQELKDHLPTESPPSEDPLSLDAAIAFVRHRSPRA